MFNYRSLYQSALVTCDPINVGYNSGYAIEVSLQKTFWNLQEFPLVTVYVSLMKAKRSLLQEMIQHGCESQ